MMRTGNKAYRYFGVQRESGGRNLSTDGIYAKQQTMTRDGMTKCLCYRKKLHYAVHENTLPKSI